VHLALLAPQSSGCPDHRAFTPGAETCAAPSMASAGWCYTRWASSLVVFRPRTSTAASWCLERHGESVSEAPQPTKALLAAAEGGASGDA